MTEKQKHRFQCAGDYFLDMIERHRRCERVDEWDDPAQIAELIEDGRIEIDPTGSLIKMTKKGLDWAVWRSESWDEHRFPPFVPTMSARSYARRRGVLPSVVETACHERIAFATRGRRIEIDVADELWPLPTP